AHECGHPRCKSRSVPLRWRPPSPSRRRAGKARRLSQMPCRDCGMVLSEAVFQSDLHLAHRFGARDHAESGWCLRIGGGRVPVRMISQVECLEPELKIEGTHSAGVELPAGTEIERTNRQKYVYGNMRCKVIVVGGTEYYALDEAIDAAAKRE